MIQDAFWGILIPFLGTSLGAGCVFFLKNSLRDGIQRALTGFAAGVMVAASVWSLLIPAMEQAADLGGLAFFPAVVGFWLGILFLLLLDHLIPHLHQNSLQAEGPKSQLQRTTMMVLAVTLHNIPEGMAVGVVYAGYLAGTAQITAAGALALSLGIAIQNFPEGAIISMPLRAEGEGKLRAFAGGVLSGVVEPIGALVTILAAELLGPALPYLLGFAAGVTAGVLLAAAAWRWQFVQAMVRPMVGVLKSTPVASFIILALVWVKTEQLATLISFIMVLPLVYNNLCQGIAAADPKLLEMAKVFELSGWKTFHCCYLPADNPFFLSAVSSALGLAWKSGIAAEVLGRPLTAIGTKIYESKVYLETADLFAWTLVIILLSVALERLLLWVTDRVQKRRKGGERDAAV